MNWAGDWIQENISVHDTVLDLGCGIMQATLDHVKSYPDTKLICKRLIGVDIYQPYLDFLDERGIETVQWDLTITPYPFEDKSVDATILTDIFEHFKKIEDVDTIISESIRITRKKLFMVTPREFFSNISTVENPPMPYDKLGGNEYQQHHILIDREYLEKKGFEVLEKSVHYYGVRNIVNKILHVCDMAGVSSIMCKYQNALGYDARVFNYNWTDKYNYSKIYGEYLIGADKPKLRPVKQHPIEKKREMNPYKVIRNAISRFEIRFSLKLKEVVDEFKPDIIHFHTLTCVPIYFKLLGYNVLLEFHGSELRRNYSDGTVNYNRRIPRKMFSVYRRLGIPLFVSTPDLLDDVPVYNTPKEISKLISNPVDTDIFNPSKYDPISGNALFILNEYETDGYDYAVERSKQRGYDLVILDREKDTGLEHLVFSDYLSRFECYIDRLNIRSLSKSALEALAIGLKVIDWKNDIVEGLPLKHDPFNVAKLTLDIYDKIMVNALE